MGKRATFGGSLSLLALAALAFVYWDQLREQVQLTYTHRALGETQGALAPTKSVTVFKNGYSTGGVQMLVSAELLAGKSGQELAEYFSQFVSVEALASAEASSSSGGVVLADRVYNGRGVSLQSYQDILPGDRLYLVAPELLFVWPFVKLGHRVQVTSETSPTKKPIIIESLTESPRTFRLHNFFDDAEADRLVERISEIEDEDSKLQQSHVGHQRGDKRVSRHRTSENAFDPISDTAISIKKRSFDVLAIGEYQEDMSDGLQLLRYKQKQAYIAHNDYFATDTSSVFNWDPSRGGSNRFATVFLYLSNVTRGGQTVFPKASMPEGLPAEYDHPEDAAEYEREARALFETGSWEIDMVQKCATKLASYPRKGGAILFYSQKPNGELDPMSLHGGCPVLEGTKWGANLWVWNRRRFGLDDTDPSEAKTKFSVTFLNPTDSKIAIYWSSTLMTTLAPGAKILYTTYTGHKWTLKRGDEVLLMFTGNAADGDSQQVVVPLPTGQKTEAKDEL